MLDEILLRPGVLALLSLPVRRRLYLEAIMVQRRLRQSLECESMDNCPPPEQEYSDQLTLDEAKAIVALAPTEIWALLTRDETNPDLQRLPPAIRTRLQGGVVSPELITALADLVARVNQVMLRLAVYHVVQDDPRAPGHATDGAGP